MVIRGSLLWCLATALLFFRTPGARAAVEPPNQPMVELITVGPGDDLLSLWGHSTLCRHSGMLEEGVCFDFGISTESNPAKLMLGTLRGEKLFVSTPIRAKRLLHNYAFRQVHRQVLPLTGEQSRHLELRLRSLIGQTYAYQPIFDNCSSRLRDLIDEIFSGRLKATTSGQEHGTPSLRVLAEQGLSGRAFLLLMTEFGAGSKLDEPPDLWSAMAFPSGLMTGVSVGLRSQPTLLHPAATEPLPTSRHAGRMLLVLLVGGLLTGLLFSPNRGRAVARVLTTCLLTGLGALPLLGLFGELPSLWDNWMLGIVCVTDGLLILGPGSRAAGIYVLGRLSIVGLLLCASAVGLIHQPLLLTGICIAVLLGGWRLSARRLSARLRGIA